jgi:fatty acid desaturase
VCWAFILLAIGLVAVHPTWWTVLIAIPIIGNRYYGLFLIGHDGMHRRILPNIKRNDFWTDLLVLAPIGAITRINNRNHLLHHRHLATLEDPDRHKHACFNKTDRVELLAFLSGVISVWISGKAVFVARGKKDPRQRQANSASDNYTFRDFALLAAWFVILAGGLTWLIGLWAYPVLWLFPAYAFMFLGDNFRSFAEHSHPEGDLAPGIPPQEVSDRLLCYEGHWSYVFDQSLSHLGRSQRMRKGQLAAPQIDVSLSS